MLIKKGNQINVLQHVLNRRGVVWCGCREGVVHVKIIEVYE